ncbi:hydroxylysine kinase [Nephila pilipes]|uniref:Hydroxylysine kinase n=1 Tax=Nephila pilipes TaxID=299642 RepID=A0A8X6TTL2_NEPPI|nr:hydroxylysine kinase [Nephila pilipes]
MEVGIIKPNVPDQLVIDLARRLYGLEVIEMKKLVSFDDQNFHIKVAKEHHNPHISQISEDGYILKFTNAVRSAMEGNFDSIHAGLFHLNKKGIRAPLPITNLEGKTWKMEKVPLLNEDSLCNISAPKICGVHLLKFIPGVPVSTQEYTADILYDWGVFLARFHNAVQDLDHPGFRTKTIFWNLEHIPELRNLMDGLEDDRKKLVLSVLDKYPSEIEKNMDHLTRGIIHGDFNGHNILVQMKSTEENANVISIDGVLDFEDMHHGTYVWDIGLMLAYTFMDCKTMDPLEGAGHALAGYLSLRYLSSLEMSVLKTCMESRLCQSLVICAYSYRTDSTNSYLLSTAKNGWSRLEKICNTSNECLLQKWKKVQENYESKNV